MKLQDKAYRQQENRRMATEETESIWRTVAEREKAAADVAAALHAAELEHQAEAMESAFLEGLKKVEAKKGSIEVEVEKETAVAVETLGKEGEKLACAPASLPLSCFSSLSFHGR